MYDAGLFDAARLAVSIEALVGGDVTLKGSGNERRAPCPICGAGETSSTPPFRVRVDRQSFTCFVCDARGDVVDFERAMRGGSPIEAARRLAGASPAAPNLPRPVRAKAPEGPNAGDKVAAEIRDGVRPFEGSLAERYLLGRGIDADTCARAAPNLRFHPNAKHHWDDHAKTWVRLPALVLQVVVAGASLGELVPTGGIHCTYLDRAGGKARVDRAKQMWGRQHAADGRPGGAWLIGPAGLGDLVVGEGIETSLSLLMLAQRKDGAPRRACAALSLGRLQGGFLRDPDGVLIEPVEPDPARPAFTWPQPFTPWREVLIGVDSDMAAVKVRIRTGGRTPRLVDGRLEGPARAQLCGRLAVKAWRAAGAPAARALAAPPGTDFNDELRRVLARESRA